MFENVSLSQFFSLEPTSSEYLQYLQQAQRFRQQRLKVYYPGRMFPSISVTGSACAMNCKYCNHKFLQHMISATSNDELVKVCKQLDAQGAKGALISGGYNARGVVPIIEFLPALSQIKESTNLILNFHTGLMTKQEAEALASIGTKGSLVSFDLVQNDRIIHDIIGLPHFVTAESYKKSFFNLIDAGLDVVPHISIGMNFGKVSLPNLQSEINLALSAPVRLVVFLGLVVKKGTAMEHASSPSVVDFQKVVLYSVLKSQGKKEISVGCMREKSLALDRALIDAGIHRIQLPRKKALAYAKQKGIEINKLYQCCAV